VVFTFRRILTPGSNMLVSPYQVLRAIIKDSRGNQAPTETELWADALLVMGHQRWRAEQMPIYHDPRRYVLGQLAPLTGEQSPVYRFIATRSAEKVSA
jgi:hypothetical protein